MPLMPKRTKYRKVQKGRNRGKATRGNKVSYGEYGIQALEAGMITSNQIESARIAMTRHVKRGGKVWIKLFPDKPITKKPAVSILCLGFPILCVAMLFMILICWRGRDGWSW